MIGKFHKAKLIGLWSVENDNDPDRMFYDFAVLKTYTVSTREGIVTREKTERYRLLLSRETGEMRHRLVEIRDDGEWRDTEEPTTSVIQTLMRWRFDEIDRGEGAGGRVAQVGQRWRLKEVSQ